MLDGIFPKVADKTLGIVTAKITGLVKAKKTNKAISDIIAEYATKSYGVTSSCELPAKMKDEYLLDELRAHCIAGDETHSQTVCRFLEIQNRDDDPNAFDFIKSLCQEITAIEQSQVHQNPVAFAAANRAANSTEAIAVDVRRIVEKLEETDAESIDSLLALIIDGVYRGEIDVNSVRSLAKKSSRNKFASNYLGICSDLMIGNEPSQEIEAHFRGNDRLLLFIASLSICSAQYDYANKTLELCSFDAKPIENLITQCFKNQSTPESPVNVTMPPDIGSEEFIALLNAELFFSMKAFPAAVLAYEKASGKLPPLAAVHNATATLWQNFAYHQKSPQEIVERAYALFDEWLPESSIRALSDIATLAFESLDANESEALISNAPQAMSGFLKDAGNTLLLRTTHDPQTALLVLRQAAENGSDGLLISAAAKLIELDSSKQREAAQIFASHKGRLRQNFGVLHYYAKEIYPGISHEELLEFSDAYTDEPAYFLLAYEIASEDNEKAADAYMEHALELMRAHNAEYCYTMADLWVHYLIKHDRENDIVLLAKDAVPAMPAFTIDRFFLDIRRAGGSNELLVSIADKISNSNPPDDDALAVVATHLAAIGKNDRAGRIALKAFRQKKTECMAGLVVQWMVNSSLKVPDDIERFVNERTSPEMQLLSAFIADSRGDAPARNALLTNAAFSLGETAKKALANYAIKNAAREELPVPKTVAPNTAVDLDANGSSRRVFFFADSRAVPANGATGPAGIAYKTSSKEFQILRDLKVGDCATIDNEYVKIQEIHRADSELSKQGFLMASSLPGVKTISSTPEDLRKEMRKMFVSDKKRSDLYRNGIEIEPGGKSIYYGIESGAITANASQINFTIGAIESTELPFRRYQISRNCLIQDDNRFLLSYNVVVLISLTGLSPDKISVLFERSCITDSTARRLERDASGLIDDATQSAGKLYLVDNEPALLKNNDDTRKSAKLVYSNIENSLKNLKRVEASVESTELPYLDAVDDNTLIDMLTAKRDDLIYVTEDCLHSEFANLFGEPKRCSLSAALFATETDASTLDEYFKKLEAWNAQPLLEIDLHTALVTLANRFIDDSRGSSSAS